MLRFTAFSVKSPSRQSDDVVFSGEEVELVVEYDSPDNRPLQNVSVSIPFYTTTGQHLFMCWTRVVGADYDQIPAQGRFIVRIPHFPLSEGTYYINLWCDINGVLADWVREAGLVTVVGGDFFGTGRVIPESHGGVLVKHAWGIGARV